MYKLTFFAVLTILIVSCRPAPPPTPPGPCELTAANAVDIYNRPSAASDVFDTFGPSDKVTPTAKTADGFYGFEPGTAQAGNVGLFRLRWVLKTVDSNLTPDCASIPTVVAPIAGICYAMMTEDTSIFSSPDTTSALVTTMHKDNYAMVVARNPGWITLDLNVASPSMNSLGYLEENNLGGFNGPCSF